MLNEAERAHKKSEIYLIYNVHEHAQWITDI